MTERRDATRVQPLVVVRVNDAGFVSAFPASAPRWVSHADEREAALEELALFLGEQLARAPGDALGRFLLPEPATVRAVPVTFEHKGPLRRKTKLPVELQTVVLEAATPGAEWALVPALDHVVYVPQKRPPELDEVVAREASRLCSARDLGGAEWLDLLPAGQLELTRPSVELGSTEEKSSLATKLAAARKLLESVGRELGRPRTSLVHRDASALAASLAAKQRRSGVLLGEPGAGKTALFVAALAASGKRAWATSGAEMVAGQSFVGQLEQRVVDVMDAVELLDGVLYFEDLDDLFAGRPGGYEDMASAMLRYVSRGRVRLFGELTPARYDELSHRQVGFFSHLERVHVAPLDRAQTVSLLAARAAGALSLGAAEQVVELTERYEPARALPGKAVTLLDEVLARKIEDRAVTRDDVLASYSARTGVPELLLRDERSLLVEDVERRFRARIIGQERAIRRVAETLATVKAGLSARGRPLAQFLFVGPTGVGKTELAKALAELLFGSAARLSRFDMSEYADAWAAERLIRGTDRDDGVLTRKIREQPFSVLLLDEIEKADPAVFDLLLQVMGEGRLSDARGRLAHFENAIIIMTSNLGAQHQRPKLGFGDEERDDEAHYAARAREHFRPEFLNRLDKIVCFASLSREQIGDVAKVALARISAREGFEERAVRLAVSEHALDHLAREGYSASYGARGLRRHLEQHLIAPVAALLSAHGSAAEGQLVYVRASAEPGDVDTLSASLSEPGLGRRLGELERGGLCCTLHGRPERRAKGGETGALRISALRREAEYWLGLGPIAALRERLGEIQAELGLLSGGKRQRRRAPRGAALAELTTEHAKLSELSAPLEARAAELRDVEQLAITSLDDAAPPDLLVPDAEAAHLALRRALGHALVQLSDESEITLDLQELGPAHVLPSFLRSMARFVEARGYSARVHLDRDQRADVPDWPPEKDRRFGPPRSLDLALEQRDLPARALLSVKGQGAGTLLMPCRGRWAWELEGGPSGLWIRPLSATYELGTEDWKHAEHAPDLAVGRRTEVCVAVHVAGRFAVFSEEERWDDVDQEDLFARWPEMIFDLLVEGAE